MGDQSRDAQFCRMRGSSRRNADADTLNTRKEPMLYPTVNLNYREIETRWILGKMNAGNSCALVGVGSVGKSNLLRHLQQPEVQKFYLGTDAANLHMIYVDPNNMLDPLPPIVGSAYPTSWAGYEIMTHRLFRHFQPLFGTMPPEVSEEFYEVYQNLLNGENPLTAHVGLRNFEYSIDLMLRQGVRLAFLFDEFELMLRELPSKFFRTLRGLRDDYKYELMYITVTRKALPDLIAELNYDYDGLEPFTELFSDSTRYIGSYSERDARDVMQQITERNNVKYAPSIQDMLIRLSGGHAGLMRSAFSAAGDLVEGLNEDEAADRLLRSRAVQAESTTIWLSLNERERDVLLTLLSARRDQVDLRSVEVRMLAEKQLLQKRGDWMTVAPPLFRAFLRAQIAAGA